MIKLGILMDAIEKIDPFHDSTVAMMSAAQKKQWEIYYFQPNDLYYDSGKVFIRAQTIRINKIENPFYQLSEVKIFPAEHFSIILQRKDPPFTMEYLYTTYLLEHIQKAGVRVVNNPASLRDANEKMFATWFSEFMSPTIVSSDKALIKSFIEQHKKVVLKPLDGMAGQSIFFIEHGDNNTNVSIETLTHNGTMHIMAQRYIPEIKTSGDKRIIMIDGKSIDYALARIPAGDDFRGNMARGARVEAVLLTKHEKNMCAVIGKTLREKGLSFVGLDVIGDYVTEINVTSPTGIQEIQKLTNLDPAEMFVDYLSEIV